MQGVPIQSDFLPYPTKGIDMILDMTRLYSLGWTMVHWERHPQIQKRRGNYYFDRGYPTSLVKNKHERDGKIAEKE